MNIKGDVRKGVDNQMSQVLKSLENNPGVKRIHRQLNQVLIQGKIKQ